MALTRRGFLGAAAGGALWACAGSGVGPSSFAAGRLSARPGQPTGSLEPGEHPLGIGTDGRDGLVYVPASYRPDAPMPFALMLHGAGGDATTMHFTVHLADRYGVVLVTPDSRGQTWDVIHGPFGPDVAFINSALTRVFGLMLVDRARVCIGGFSDGASYALSLGLANGNLFTHVMAFSPGVVAKAGRVGKPRIFVSHGTEDTVLPIDGTSRVIVPQLRQQGYDVTYREFAGPHTVPSAIGDEAFAWFAT